MARPDPEVIPVHYKGYIDLVPESDIFSALETQGEELLPFLDRIHSSDARYAYAPGKWTVAQVLQHMIDSERIFAYRILCISRGDKTPLPGYDENKYAANATASHRNLEELTEEMLTVRKASTLLMESLTEDAWNRTGTSNNHAVDVLSLSYLVVGHMRHHMKVLEERYGI